MNKQKQHCWAQLLALGTFVVIISGCNKFHMDQLAMQGVEPEGEGVADEGEAVEPEGEAATDDPVAKLAESLGKKYEIQTSTNCGERQYIDPKEHQRTGAIQLPTMVVLSYTVGNKVSVETIFMDNKQEKSAHYLVDRQGNITRFVSEDKRAWHAGHGSWKGEKDVNTVSIGIAAISLGFKHQDHHPAGTQVRGVPEEWYHYDPELLKTLGRLCQYIIQRYGIKPDNVIGHSDMSTNPSTGNLGRKVDPGPLFPWESFHKDYGIGAWYDPASLSEVELPSEETKVRWVQENLKKYGYACPQTRKLDTGTTRAVKAFQMHFRPTHISGEIDDETIQILAQLVDRYIEQG